MSDTEKKFQGNEPDQGSLEKGQIEEFVVQPHPQYVAPQC